MTRPAPNIVSLADAEAVATHAADWLLERAIAKTGRFSVSLSGGSTPRQLYEKLARSPYRDRMPWDRVHWFWGDERFVPPDDPRSNQRMVRAAMLKSSPAPEANIHPIPTEGLQPEEAALEYERELKSFYGATMFDRDRPLFDVTLLGLGADGHTASLFPDAAALDVRRAWVAATQKNDEPRITLTYPAIKSSRDIAFLIVGAEKREMLARVLEGDRALPAARVKSRGSMWFFCDKAALGH